MNTRSGHVDANGISIFYEDLGDLKHPVIVLVCGMGVQLIQWPDEFCNSLVNAGYRVIRFDNRETGLTSRSHVKSPPPIIKSFIQYRLGRKVRADYDLDTLAYDAISLLDALSIKEAHWIGASMGGMICQLIASQYHNRVLSLTSIMSTTNEPHLPGPRLDLLKAIITPPKDRSEKEIVASTLNVQLKLQSPKFKGEKSALEDFTRRAIARSRRPYASPMHQMAIFSTGGFSHRLHRINVPTLIIHGDKDNLVRHQGGRHSAKSIPNAKLEIIRGMGHDMPPKLVGKISDLVTAHIHGASTT